MRRLTHALPPLAACALLFAAAAVRAEDAPPAAAPLPAPVATPAAETAPRRAVDLVVCLDTSGSMQNLIESAKQNIWAVVNDLALVRPQPHLRVALLTYGNDGHDPAAGWVRVETDLTEDLDLVSERLFALSTNGGTELVARVLRRAHDALAWSAEQDALRLLVVAGNESADQDQEVAYADACAALATRGVLVDALYCGAVGDEIAPGWQDVAKRGEGRFAAIEHGAPPRVIETPHDAALARLSTELNGTYIPYGAAGAAGAANQIAQDCNAGGLNGAAAASRAGTKASCNYRCAWDLVDALAADATLDLAKIPAEELPEAMREMDADARRAHVDHARSERARIRKEIEALTARRDAYVAAERAKDAALAPTFESELLRSVREQAAAHGFTFAK